MESVDDLVALNGLNRIHETNTCHSLPAFLKDHLAWRAFIILLPEAHLCKDVPLRLLLFCLTFSPPPDTSFHKGLSVLAEGSPVHIGLLPG